MLEIFVWPINLGLQWRLFNFTSLIVHYVHSIFTILYWNQWRATWYLFVFVCCLGTWFHRGEDPPRHPWKSSSLPALFTGRISTLSEKHCSRRCWASGRPDFNRLQPVSYCIPISNLQIGGLPWFASDWRSLSAARLQDVKAQIFEGLRRLRVEIPSELCYWSGSGPASIPSSHKSLVNDIQVQFLAASLVICSWIINHNRIHGHQASLHGPDATADRFVDFPLKTKQCIMHHVSAKNMAFPLKWHTVTRKV